MADLNLTCCCCGGGAPAKEQWHNRDTGYGLCGRCADYIKGRSDYDAAEFRSCYGDEGVHWIPCTPETAPEMWQCPDCGGRTVLATVHMDGRFWCVPCQGWKVRVRHA